MWNTAQVEAGTSAAVFGLGAVGLSVIEGLVKAGATQIIAVDILDSKLELAKQWGATHFVNPNTILPKAVQQHIIEISPQVTIKIK